MTSERLAFEFGRQFEQINDKFSRSKFVGEVGILVMYISQDEPFRETYSNISSPHGIVRFSMPKKQFLTVECGDIIIDLSTWNI